jgi:hypothetical protein
MRPPRRNHRHTRRRRREDIATGKTSRETVYAIASMTSARVTTQDLARLVREHWSVEASTTSGT